VNKKSAAEARANKKATKKANKAAATVTEPTKL
jgi:hypothetical protein